MNADQPQHITEEDLESYSMAARIPGLKLAEMEEHLLVCALCRQRLVLCLGAASGLVR